jgi:peptidoglycan/xylan/chitin deacetylase (PgdA/CDA1 family)
MNPKSVKTAILTYHRIVNGEPLLASDWSFYDVPMQTFERQMELVSAHQRLGCGSQSVLIEVTFDDGTEDHLLAAEILARLGLSGIFFVIVGRLNTPGYLQISDLRTLLALNQRIGSHTITHRRLPLLSPQELNIELEQSRDILEQESGRKIEWLAPPGGILDDRVFRAALAAGYRYVRTMDWGYAPSLATSPIGKPLSSIPILPTTRESEFDRIIDGHGSFLLFQLKQHLKRAIGDSTYTQLRNIIMKHWLRPQHR